MAIGPCAPDGGVHAGACYQTGPGGASRRENKVRRDVKASASTRQAYGQLQVRQNFGRSMPAPRSVRESSGLVAVPRLDECASLRGRRRRGAASRLGPRARGRALRSPHNRSVPIDRPSLGDLGDRYGRERPVGAFVISARLRVIYTTTIKDKSCSG